MTAGLWSRRSEVSRVGTFKETRASGRVCMCSIVQLLIPKFEGSSPGIPSARVRVLEVGSLHFLGSIGNWTVNSLYNQWLCDE